MSPELEYVSRNGFFRPSLAVCMYAKETTHFYQPYLHGFCFNLVNFEALLRLELTIHLLQSDGVVDSQNCRQCNPSSTKKVNNIRNVLDEGVVDAFVDDEKANNIGPIVSKLKMQSLRQSKKCRFCFPLRLKIAKWVCT